MPRIDLTGTWTLHADSPVLGQVSVPCQIPGDCHSALLSAGLIPDPYYGDQELAVQFLNREELILERNIEVRPEQIQQGSPYLYFESIDTVATVLLNNEVLAETNNMFHAHILDLGNKLQAGTNTITIHFHSAEKAAEQRAKQLPYPIPHSVYPVQSLHRNQIRKVQCHSGWDWGPCLMVSGVYGACYLDFACPGRIEGLSVRTLAREDNRWDLPVSLTYTIPSKAPAPDAKGASEDYLITMKLSLRDSSGNTVMEQTTEHSLHGPGVHQLEALLSIKNPELWWPAGYGEQHLYTLEAAVWSIERAGTGGKATPETAIQRASKRIGFRDLKVITQDDEAGRSMTFQVNGRAIWAKGANWIPLDSLPSRQTAHL
uniref:beta-mannosidase n=1 Tax=Gracilinema caldarium TaxID=215591 RepID=A0A7C3IR20_9SPIR